MKYEYIEKFLKEGWLLHGFRSGGGLRVLSMKPNKLLPKNRGAVLAEDFGLVKNTAELYGESHNLWEALRILNDDAKAGGRKYKDVYGKIEDNYMTGSYTNENDPVDAWIGGGRKFDIHYDGEFILDMSILEHIHTPKPICQLAYKGETVHWKVNGDLIYVRTSSPMTLTNGEIACTTKLTPPANGLEDMVIIERIAKGTSLDEIIENAKEKTKPFEVEYTILTEQS